jgi:hypothetical protein
VYSTFKKVLKRCIFELIMGMKATVVQRFHQQPTEFFTEKIQWLVHQWDACFNTYIICNGLYSFNLNNSQMGFILTATH